jgi:hypothetical protein
MGPLLSDDKHTHLSHVILQALQGTPEGTLRGASAQALKEIKRILTDSMKAEEHIHQLVRSRLNSYSRRIPEGSLEWDVLYQKTYKEELRKRQLG